jgi:undecaprenyl diphosphate synthase
VTCSVALSYGGKQDIVQAAQHASQLVADGKLKPEDVTEELFQSLLLTKGMVNASGPPDLLIRCDLPS